MRAAQRANGAALRANQVIACQTDRNANRSRKLVPPPDEPTEDGPDTGREHIRTGANRRSEESSLSRMFAILNLRRTECC
jgi:hypothetical protein